MGVRRQQLSCLWIALIFLQFIRCQSRPSRFIQSKYDFNIVENKEELPANLKDFVDFDVSLNPILVASSEHDTTLFITTISEVMVQWKFQRNNSDKCQNAEQKISICYLSEENNDGNVFQHQGTCPPMNCQLNITLSNNNNMVENGYASFGDFKTSVDSIYLALSSDQSDNKGKLQFINNSGGTHEACRLNTRFLEKIQKFHAKIIIQKSGTKQCNPLMTSYGSNVLISGEQDVASTTQFDPFYTTTQSVAAAIENWRYLLLIVFIMFVYWILFAVIIAVIIKWKWFKKKFQKRKKNVRPQVPLQLPVERQVTHIPLDETKTAIPLNKENKASDKPIAKTPPKKEELKEKISKKDVKIAPVQTEMKPTQVQHNSNIQKPSCSTQPSLSCDKTPPRTEAEMTPDELEYLAFSTIDSGKRYRIFRTAVKLAEKIAESHGYWINDRDPTVPGDEEDWLKREADSLVRACCDLHGIPVPEIGATHNEHLDYINKHSLREIYQVSLYSEVAETTRMHFLNAAIERFNELVKQIPSSELAKGQHPLPLLLRVHQEHPEVFDLRPKKYDKPKEMKK